MKVAGAAIRAALRIWAGLTVLLAGLWLGMPTQADGFSALARIDAERSGVVDHGRRGVRIGLQLGQGVPYRLFTLTDPPRLVIDFREVDWSGIDPDTLLQTGRIEGLRVGAYVPGWSRLVADLGAPFGIDSADMRIDEAGGAARLEVVLAPVGQAEFADAAGAPHDPRWDLPPLVRSVPPPARDPGAALVVVLDPGHGGIDPGAEAGGIEEKALMLSFARELRETLLRSDGFEVVLTREGDHFVSLDRRVALAHRAGADLFLSLHADSLAQGGAQGTTVHLLSEDASDIASAKLAERHDRGDLLSGVDLRDTDDQVTDVLLDLARQETRPRTEALARALTDAIGAAGAPLNRRPLRRAGFSVLKAADIPSVLIELGFMSNPRDLENLRDPAWRARMAGAIRDGLQAWRSADAAIRPLARQ